MSVRVYLPSTFPMLRGVLDTGEVGDPPLPGYAVTPELREWYASGDLEERLRRVPYLFPEPGGEADVSSDRGCVKVD